MVACLDNTGCCVQVCYVLVGGCVSEEDSGEVVKEPGAIFLAA